MAGLFAYLAAEIAGRLKQKALVFGVIAAGGLIAFFALAYALDAIHSMLMFRYGGVAASLTVAATLIVAAVLCVVVAIVLRRHPVPPPAALKRSSPYHPAPTQQAYSNERLVAVGAALAGGLSTGALLVGSKALRSLLRHGRISKAGDARRQSSSVRQ